MTHRSAAIALSWVLASSASLSRAEPLLDQGYFSAAPHTLVDFETDGAGDPVGLNQGLSKPLPADAYLSRGFWLSTPVQWVNDGNADFDAAQAIGGSPEVAIPGGSFDNFIVYFVTPASAFGFWVVNNQYFSVVPSFEARRADGSVIESVSFSGLAIDGAIGAAQYGFLGIAADEGIYSIHIRKDATLFDDFRFTHLPEPGVLLTFGAAAFAAVARRRR